MEIQIVYGRKGASEAKGLCIVVDVFRAATCASVAFAKGAKIIYPVQTVEEAFLLKNEFPAALMIGEERGIKIEGFDMGNSPMELEMSNLEGKIIIQRTSAGTQGLVLAGERLGKEVEEILFGGFTTFSAVIHHITIMQTSMVTIVAMDGIDTEDSYYAECLKKAIEGEEISKQNIEMYLHQHKKSAHFFDPTCLSHPEEDFYVCVDKDRYDFIVRTSHEENRIVLHRS